MISYHSEITDWEAFIDTDEAFYIGTRTPPRRVAPGHSLAWPETILDFSITCLASTWLRARICSRCARSSVIVADLVSPSRSEGGRFMRRIKGII